MPESRARTELIQRLLQAAAHDPRIAGIVDYGSGSEGRLDQWSDLDVTLFVRDADLERFAEDWVPWAAQFGELLLAYVGHIGHPWTVYDASPVPLRVDFEFQPESAISRWSVWPNSPASLAAMVLFDRT